MNRRQFNRGLAALPLIAGLGHHAFAQGQGPAPGGEPLKVSLGVGGAALLYYLPLTIAHRLGFFEEAGLAVTINDFGSGNKALQALVGGSVDVVTSDYAHTIRMQARGQDIRAIVELGRFPGIVVAVRKELAGQVKSAADFKGLKLGVTSPGSVSALLPQFAMVKAGLKATDAPIIGVGTTSGAVAAIKQGSIDIISHLDPAIAKLEADGDIVVLIDTRTEAGTRALFGGANPAATCYTTAGFIEERPEAAQRLVIAFLKALNWLDACKPADVAKVVPPEYLLGDEALYVRAVGSSLPTYSRTGRCDPQGMKSAYDMLKLLDAELKGTNVDLARTFDDRFLRKVGKA